MYSLPPNDLQFSSPVSILLVDDCPTFRQGLKNLLDFHNTTSPWQFQIVGQAASLQQALNLAIQQSPMLILLDMELAQGNGVEVLQHLRSHAKTSHTLVLSGHQEEEYIFQAMQAGARGYLFKHHLFTQLLEAVQVVLQNQIYLSPEVATRFFQRFHFVAGRSMAGMQTVHLTEREREVLQWLAQGASNEVIAQQLSITVGTVKAYLTTIFEKLAVNSRTQAALQALKMGLVSA
jgi:DNA-binding NarL/FixJ family response regulator